MGEELDRRPIAARELKAIGLLAEGLARRGVSPNAISVAGMIAGLLAGAALVLTVRAPAAVRLSWVAAAAFIQLRLLANLLDGMVAVAGGKTSRVGELYNEIPDRVSDTAALAGLGYAAGGDPLLGWMASLAAMFTAYVRATGRGAGARQDFSGPMAKPHRMAVVTATALFCAASPLDWQSIELGGRSWGVPAFVLAAVLVGSVATALRRLVRIARALREGAP